MQVFALILWLLFTPISPAQPIFDVPHTLAEEAAAVCKGEASFAVDECVCTVHNRLFHGWSEELVVKNAYFATPQPVSEDEIARAKQILDGEIACDPDLYFIFEPYSVQLLGFEAVPARLHIDAPGRPGVWVRFYARRDWNDSRRYSQPEADND